MCISEQKPCLSMHLGCVLHPHYRGKNGRVISLQMREIACKTGYAEVTKNIIKEQLATS